MNKRQKRKKSKTLSERLEFTKKNSRPYIYWIFERACYSKHYKPFKLLKKFFAKIIIGIDLSRTRDISVERIVKISKGSVEISKYRIIDEMHDYKG